MIEDYEISGIGHTRIKSEGAIAHPDDRLHCGCEKCEEHYQKQLTAYLDSLVKNARTA